MAEVEAPGQRSFLLGVDTTQWNFVPLMTGRREVTNLVGLRHRKMVRLLPDRLSFFVFRSRTPMENVCCSSERVRSPFRLRALFQRLLVTSPIA